MQTQALNNSTEVVENYLKQLPDASSGICERGFFSNRIRHTALVAAVAIPTVVQPVIKTQFETEIVIERQFHQSVSFSGSFSSVGVLPSVPSGYVTEASNKIENYLLHNNDLLGFLSKIPAQINKRSGIDSIELELYHDIEEDWEKLFIIVNTEISDIDELEKALFSSLFEPEAKMLSGRVVLSVG